MIRIWKGCPWYRLLSFCSKQVIRAPSLQMGIAGIAHLLSILTCLGRGLGGHVHHMSTTCKCRGRVGPEEGGHLWGRCVTSASQASVLLAATWLKTVPGSGGIWRRSQEATEHCSFWLLHIFLVVTCPHSLLLLTHYYSVPWSIIVPCHLAITSLDFTSLSHHWFYGSWA